VEGGGVRAGSNEAEAEEGTLRPPVITAAAESNDTWLDSR
jgi:hypothetical protein